MFLDARSHLNLTYSLKCKLEG